MARRKTEGPKATKFPIRYVETTSLNPSAYNPRKINPREFAKLRRLIKEFGFVEPVVLRAEGNQIVGGHQRVRAALAEDVKKIPAVFLNITDARAKALNLALNRIGGEWNIPDLKDVLAELDDLEDSDIGITGFDHQEIQDLVAKVKDGELEEMNLKPPPKMVWILAGIPINQLGSVQADLAALEDHSDIFIQSSRG